MTEYEKLASKDLVQYMTNDMYFNGDGKIESLQRISADSVWIYNRELCSGKDAMPFCTNNHSIFNEKMGFIPTRCHSCWKVVIKPRTVTELFKLYDIIEKYEKPAKCGVEIRDYVKYASFPYMSLYGGYAYNKTIEEGKKCLEFFKKRVGERISKDIPVMLKRGCTEFEIKYGDPDKWMISPFQGSEEKKWNDAYTEVGGIKSFPEFLIAHIKRRWIHYAAKHGDKSYKELTGGVALVPEIEYKTY